MVKVTNLKELLLEITNNYLSALNESFTNHQQYHA